MAVLFLGPPSPLLTWLCGETPDVRHSQEQIDTAQLIANPPDFIVSYGYRHLIAREAIEAVQGRAINLHISYLPWNRGADPNLWSILDATPIGVTIHYVDEHYDTGDIIAQRLVAIDLQRDTLRTSYAALHMAIQSLFRTCWSSIRSGTCGRRPQPAKGSFHRARDGRALLQALPLVWETPVADLISICTASRVAMSLSKRAPLQLYPLSRPSLPRYADPYRVDRLAITCDACPLQADLAKAEPLVQP